MIPRMTREEKKEEIRHYLYQLPMDELRKTRNLVHFMNWQTGRPSAKMTLLTFLFGAWIYYTEYQPMMLNK